LTEVIDKKYKGEVIKTAKRVAEILLEDYEVAVVPCADFGFPNHMRLYYDISLKSITKGLDRIEAFLGTVTR
jgi:aspartate aminotransferase